MKPNIIFILADDHSYFGINKECKSLISPNLNAMADKGAYFTNCFCASPVCSPARASMLTGLLPSAHGVHDWIISGNLDYDTLPDKYKNRKPIKNNEKSAVDYLEGFETYTDILADNGYDIALSGKWHLGDSVKKRRGYTYWNVILRGGCSYFNYELYNQDSFEDHTEYVTDKITDNAIDYLKNRKKDKPFYLGVHYTAPHTPWDKDEHKAETWKLYENSSFPEFKFGDLENGTPQNKKIHPDHIWHEYIGDSEEKRLEFIRGYFSAITAMDEGIGKIIEQLTAQNELKNTLIIFTGDNGMNLGHHGVWGKGNGTYPQNFYEESIKVPLIMYQPGSLSPLVFDGMVSHLDLFDTILDYAGCQTKTTSKTAPAKPGSSFAGVFKGQKFTRDNIPITSEYGAVRMLRTERYKLVKNYIDGNNIFYDLHADPQEKTNQIENKQYAAIIAQMSAEMDKTFEKYSIPDHDGRYQFPKGMGQVNKVKKADGNVSFMQNLTMYRDVPQKTQN